MGANKNTTLLTKTQSRLSKKAIEGDIKHFEFMLAHYTFTNEERCQVQGYLANARKQLMQIAPTKAEMRVQR